jgi:hypothetical protein
MVSHRRVARIGLQGVGHLPMLEEPEKCALDYVRFRATL